MREPSESSRWWHRTQLGTKDALQEETMTRRQGMTRRDALGACGMSALAFGLALPRRVYAQAGAIRQGYQTNVWGMPTYYLLRSGALERRGLKFEEFGVPSGNLTMQQMVARQVDRGTYADA